MSSNLNNISQQDINNSVSDSVITRVAREFRGSPGVFIGISHGTELIHNEISFLPYSAVSVGWGWASYPHSFGGANRIVGNHIHSHMQLLGDVSHSSCQWPHQMTSQVLNFAQCERCAGGCDLLVGGSGQHAVRDAMEISKHLNDSATQCSEPQLDSRFRRQ